MDGIEVNDFSLLLMFVFKLPSPYCVRYLLCVGEIRVGGDSSMSWGSNKPAYMQSVSLAGRELSMHESHLEKK